MKCLNCGKHEFRQVEEVFGVIDEGELKVNNPISETRKVLGIYCSHCYYQMYYQPFGWSANVLLKL